MSAMLDYAVALDRSVFFWINDGLSNPLFDALLPWFRERFFWAPLYLFLGAFSWTNFGKKGWVIVLGLVCAAGLADFTSSTLVKKNVQRLRPCNDPAMVESVRLRAPCGGGYSFTSSHAANHFAAAVFLIGIFGRTRRWIRPAAIGWASLIALSQVYVGVHYPGDVLAGAGIGAGAGWLMLKLLEKRIGRINDYLLFGYGS